MLSHQERKERRDDGARGRKRETKKKGARKRKREGAKEGRKEETPNSTADTEQTKGRK